MALLVYLCFVESRLPDQHNLLHDSPRLKTTCVRHVVLDKLSGSPWEPAAVLEGRAGGPQGAGDFGGVLIGHREAVALQGDGS